MKMKKKYLVNFNEYFKYKLRQKMILFPNILFMCVGVCISPSLGQNPSCASEHNSTTNP